MNGKCDQEILRKLEKKMDRFEKRMNDLDKMNRSRLVGIVNTYYRICDLEGSSKWILIWMVLEAEFGQKFCENI